MQIEIANLTKNRIGKKYFQKIGEIVLKKLKQPEDMEISLVFVCDARMKGLNKKYRGINKTTDVLSFDYRDMKIPPYPSFKPPRCNCFAINEKGGKFPPPFSKEGRPARQRFAAGMAGGGGFSGEIVISIPQAKKQAIKRSYPLKRELTELFVHGILHLAGYNDEKEKDYKEMIEKQENIWKLLKV